MGKQFNIKDERAIELAQAIASHKGQSVTATIREVPENEHARLEEERQRKVERILAIGADFRARLPPGIAGIICEGVDGRDLRRRRLTGVIVDTSAFMAVLIAEPDASVFARR